MKSFVIGDTIHLESEIAGCDVMLKYIASENCPPDRIYFLPRGSRSENLATGETTELAPGYYVNPSQLGMIKNVKIR